MKYPEIAVQQLINNIDVKNKIIVMNIWRALIYLSEKGVDMPNQFCSETIRNLRKKPGAATENKQNGEYIFRFLRIILQKKPDVFSEEEKGYIISNMEFTSNDT